MRKPKSVKCSEETKKKLRLISLGKKLTQEAKDKISKGNTGKKRTTNHNINNGLKHNKAIIQMDLEGNFIKEWSSIKEASTQLNINNVSMCICLKKRTKTSGRFKWKYKKDNN